MITRRFLLLATASLSAAVALPRDARAGAAEQAVSFIEALAKELTAVVNGNAPIADKQSALGKIVDRGVDVEEVAKFCLGRFWRTATPQQQKDYTELFHRVLLNNITGKVGEYKGVSIAIGKPIARDSDIAVTSVVTRPGNEPSKVDWLVSMSSGAPRVIDVIAEGTSLRLTQRSDYASYLSRNNNSVQALIDAIRAQANNPG
jgi:phospholipid transport system substrate-binding protein